MSRPVTIHPATPCSPPAGALCEGPVWDGEHVLWVDIIAGEVHRAEVAPGPDLKLTSTLRLEPPVSAVIPCATGGLLVAAGMRVLRLSEDGPPTELVELPDSGDGIRRRANDAKVDPRGRLLVGTMSEDGVTGTAALYQVELDFRLSTLLDDVTISNGLGWGPDGATLYYADTPTRQVVAYDYDLESGTISGRRPFVEFDTGYPDGLAVDVDGNVWIALWGAGQVQAFDPAGEQVAVVEVGPSQVSSCAFVGPDRDILVITTAALDHASGEPNAGKVFIARPGVAGVPVPPFGEPTC